jgi:ankyrin repeat protein
LTTVQIKQIESSGRDERLQLVLTVPGLSTTMLQLLLEELSRAEADLRELKKDHADEHPEVASKRKQLDLVWQRLDKQVEAVIKVLKVRREALQETIKLLQPRIAQASSQADAAPKSKGTVPTDEEETEIRRLQAMIQNSPDLINGPGAGGMTPLCQAANKGQLRVAQFLLDHGAAIDRKANNMTPLHDAVARGHETMVELLLQRGADVNARDGTGGTALHEAAQDGFLSVAEVLVQHKADLNVRNSQMNDEQTPLHRAIEKGFTEMATFLVSKGADVNAQTKRGRSPLGVAASRGHMKILSELLGAGAKLDLEDKDGLTPLAYAVSGGHLDCARRLLSAGANPNAGKDGGALCWPGPVSVPEGVRLLLEAGANPNAKRADGQTPLLTATEKGYYESAVILLKHGADVNATNGLGMTPLQMAVWAESLPMVSLLLTNHANVNAPGPVGRNALIMAKEAEGGFRPYTPGDYGGRSRTPDKEVARKIANLLRQHGAKEGSPTSEAARPPEKP